MKKLIQIGIVACFAAGCGSKKPFVPAAPVHKATVPQVDIEEIKKQCAVDSEKGFYVDFLSEGRNFFFQEGKDGFEARDNRG